MNSNNSPKDTSSSNRIVWAPLVYRYLLPMVVIAVVLAFIPYSKPEPIDPYPISALENHSPFRYRGSFNGDFNDLNDIQLECAIKIGISPAKNRAELEKSKRLVSITDSNLFKLDDLKYSSPVLIPEAAVLLEDISQAFIDALRVESLPIYLPIVTSVTRTTDDIRSLSKGNINASSNSTHRYGTTFDISWKRFHKANPNDPRSLDSEELKHLLAITLRDFHQQGRCYIKHERKQACFHVTVR